MNYLFSNFGIFAINTVIGRFQPFVNVFLYIGLFNPATVIHSFNLIKSALK
jgi:hypothetical protein